MYFNTKSYLKNIHNLSFIQIVRSFWSFFTFVLGQDVNEFPMLFEESNATSQCTSQKAAS